MTRCATDSALTAWMGWISPIRSSLAGHGHCFQTWTAVFKNHNMFKNVQKFNHFSLVPVNLRSFSSLKKRSRYVFQSDPPIDLIRHHVDTLRSRANKQGQANKEDRGPKATLSRAAPWNACLSWCWSQKHQQPILPWDAPPPVTVTTGIITV